MRRGGPGRGPGRVGVQYLLLSVLGAAGALAVARHFKLGTAGTAAIAVTVLLGLASSYMAWVQFRYSRADAAAVDLDTAAGQLAVAVKAQWDEESAVRRVNDPYPLPVAWRAADDDLAEPWPLLTDLARAWPGGPPGDPARWPQHAAGLAGQDAQISEVFTNRVPTRRLVVLGEPGAGKSVLLIRLLQDLLERRTDTTPVPVLFSLASWNPRQPLKTWMADQLRRTYSGLRASAPTPVTANGPGDLAQALLDAGHILPLLDGFDELPPGLHPAALDALNRALPARQPLVLTSRTAPYRDALTRPGATVRLNGAAAVQLLPLDPSQAAAYLRRDAGGPHISAADRWDAVAAQLGTDTPVGQALSTPLGLFLARTIYNPRPAFESAATPVVPRPDELCDATAFPDRAAVDAHLFNVFIPAAYNPHHPHPPRWSVQQAQRTLVFLAQHLEDHRDGSPDLAWWELLFALPAYARRLIVGLVYALAVGLGVGLTDQLGNGLGPQIGYGLPAGLVAGLVFGRLAHTPRARLSWSPRDLAQGFVFAAIGWLIAQILDVLTGDFIGDGFTGIGFTGRLILVGLAAGFVNGLKTERLDVTTMVEPATLLAQDRRTFLAYGVGVGLGVGVMVGPSYGLMAGLGVGVGVGLGVALRQTAWGGWTIARACLIMRRKIPRDLITFLQDAHQHRGVLRQVGAVYQFRHIDLQRHLAQQQT